MITEVGLLTASADDDFITKKLFNEDLFTFLFQSRLTYSNGFPFFMLAVYLLSKQVWSLDHLSIGIGDLYEVDTRVIFYLTKKRFKVTLMQIWIRRRKKYWSYWKAFWKNVFIWAVSFTFGLLQKCKLHFYEKIQKVTDKQNLVLWSLWRYKQLYRIQFKWMF